MTISANNYDVQITFSIQVNQSSKCLENKDYRTCYGKPGRINSDALVIRDSLLCYKIEKYYDDLCGKKCYIFAMYVA